MDNRNASYYIIFLVENVHNREINRHIQIFKKGLRIMAVDCKGHIIPSWDDENVWELDISDRCAFLVGHTETF